MTVYKSLSSSSHSCTDCNKHHTLYIILLHTVVALNIALVVTVCVKEYFFGSNTPKNYNLYKINTCNKLRLYDMTGGADMT